MNINIVGSFSLVGASRSWGIVLTNFALALKSLDHTPLCLTTNGQTNIDPRIRPLLVNAPDPAAPTFTYTIAPELGKLNGDVYCMTAFESSILPKGWAETYTRPGVRVIVNSEQQRELFAVNGVRAVVVPLGVDTSIYTPEGDKLKIGGDKFKFLSIGICHFRKGFDILLRAFADEFEPDENVALVIKTDKLEKCNYWEIDIMKEIKKVQEKPTAEIILVSGDCENLAPLYRACQCYVSPTRAEGFGMTILEARACGLPVIATGRIVDGFGTTRINCKQKRAPAAAQYHTFDPNAEILEPHADDLQELMRNAFNGELIDFPFDPSAWAWAAAARKLLDVMGIRDEFDEWIKGKNAT